ncbi:MAG: molecular chaperone [Anaerolineae bacterium]
MPSKDLTRWRQGLYRLFGALFLYPDAERLTTLRTVAGELQQERDFWVDDSALSDPFQRLLQALAGLAKGANVRVEEEYTRLFTVKPAAPPYESFYLDPEGYTRGWILVQLEREYAEAGLALSPSLKEPPDHIAVELEFMAFLCHEQARAWEEDALEVSTQAKDRQCAFIGQHLGRWFPQFAQRVKDAAPEALYGVVVEAADAFLHHDLELLRHI